MIGFKLCIFLVISIAVILFVHKNDYFRKQLNGYLQSNGWANAEVFAEKELDLMFEHYPPLSKWSRPEWGLTEAVIGAVTACVLLLSGWKLNIYFHAYEGKIEEMVENRVEELSVKLENKIILTFYSELEDIREELAHLNKMQEELTDMTSKGIQENLTYFKTCQVDYFPNTNQEPHINDGIDNICLYKAQNNQTSKAEPCYEGGMIVRNIAGCDASKSCDINEPVEEKLKEITNLETNQSSYTVVCPVVVEVATDFEEIFNSSYGINKISEPIITIDENVANNKNSLSPATAINSLTEETNKLSEEVPESPTQKAELSVATVGENVKVLPNKMCSDVIEHQGVLTQDSILLDNHTSIGSKQCHQENEEACQIPNTMVFENNTNIIIKDGTKHAQVHDCGDVPFICSFNRSEESNDVKSHSKSVDEIVEPKEVTQRYKSYSQNRPTSQGMKKPTKKQDDIEIVGSLTNPIFSKAESTIGRVGALRHQYGSSSPRPESPDNRRKKQRNASAKMNASF